MGFIVSHPPKDPLLEIQCNKNQKIDKQLKLKKEDFCKIIPIIQKVKIA
jgi:hypothetical protein